MNPCQLLVTAGFFAWLAGATLGVLVMVYKYGWEGTVSRLAKTADHPLFVLGLALIVIFIMFAGQAIAMVTGLPGIAFLFLAGILLLPAWDYLVEQTYDEIMEN
jgi:hypothetical protein